MGDIRVRYDDGSCYEEELFHLDYSTLIFMWTFDDIEVPLHTQIAKTGVLIVVISDPWNDPQAYSVH